MANTSAIFKGSRTKLLTKDGLSLEAGQNIKVVDGAAANAVMVSDALGVVALGAVPAITALTGEVTGTGPGSTAATVTNSAVIGKVLTGLTAADGALAAGDTVLGAFGKLSRVPMSDAANQSLSGFNATSIVGALNEDRASISDAGCSGLVSWGGAGDFYSYTGGTFTVLRAGVGRINGKKITWAGGESVAGLASNKGYLIGFTATNTLEAIDISTLVSSNKQAEFDLFDAFYRASIVVFGIWTDGAYPQIVKEDHPYEYSTDISVHDHFKFGQTFTFGGALLSVLTAASRTIQTSGEDMLDDHGLTTRIADQAGSILDCFAIFQNGSGIAQALARTGFNVTGVSVTPTAGAVYSNNGNQYTVFVSTLVAGAGLIATWTSTGVGIPEVSGNLTKVSGTGDATIAFTSYTIPTSITYTYAPAGVPTLLGSGGGTRYGIIAIYASKDDKQSPNTTTPLPKYFQIMSNTAYGSASDAANSIGSGASPNVSQFIMPSEMRAIEIVLNGFVIIDGSPRDIEPTNTNGFVIGVKTVKASISTGSTGGSVTATTAVNVSTSTANFGGLLSSADTQVQQALDSIDDYMAVVPVSSNMTLVRNRVHIVDTSAARTLAFPTLVASHGSMVIVKDGTGTADVNNITITQSAAETIDGVAASYVMTVPYGSLTFYSDGVSRWII
jgi:hypothetical protein